MTHYVHVYLNSLGVGEPTGFLAGEWTVWKALKVSFTNQFLAYPTLTAVVQGTVYGDSMLYTHTCNCV